MNIVMKDRTIKKKVKLSNTSTYLFIWFRYLNNRLILLINNIMTLLCTNRTFVGVVNK